jgi:hypothetical protein
MQARSNGEQWQMLHAPPGGGVHSNMTPSHAPGMPDERARQNTPLWMDVSPTQQQPEGRRGATSAPRSGLSTLLFFALIIFGVGAAGIFGVTMWGPDKTVTSRSHLATNPPPPTTMPSLPEEAPPAPPVVESAPAPVDSAAAAAAPGKKKKSTSPKAKKH